MDSKITFGNQSGNERELVREALWLRLRNESDWQTLSHYVLDQRYFDRYVVFQPADSKARFHKLLIEVLWEFICLGILTPGPSRTSYNYPADLNLPHFHISAYGAEVLKCGRLIPQDPAGFLKEAKAVGKLCFDDVAEGYLEEALRCCGRSCYTASVLLLGVCAETTFLLLCQHVENAISDNSVQEKFAGADGVKLKHRIIVQRYEQLSSKIRRTQLPDGLDITLKGVYDLIRRQRNDLGHPQNIRPEVDREHAFAHFQCFLTYLRDIEAFAQFCRDNSL